MNRSFSKFFTGSVIVAAVVFSLSLPAPANAQRGGRASVPQRMQNTQRREQLQIRQGYQNGDLTRAQAMNLENHMRQMQSSIAQDKANGKLTRKEAKQLKNETKKLEKSVNGAETSNDKGTMPPTQH